MKTLQNPRYLSVLVIAVLALGLAGCARTVPQSVTDVNTAMSRAKDACAGTYAADEMAPVQRGVDSMNSLGDEGKYRKASKAAEPLLPQVQSLETTAAKSRDKAESDAEVAIATATGNLAEALRAEADKYAPEQYQQAREKLDAARAATADPCKYGEALELAKSASMLSSQAMAAAGAEKQRLEAERLAEEERLRLEREREAREAEARRLSEVPANYTVVKGDSLWKISGMDKIYKNSIYWGILHEANVASVADPDLIFPGQEFSIPRDLTSGDMDKLLMDYWRQHAND
jgi:nucleoid-associated protein YgaU